MITLQEHLDALDRMVTQGTSVPELRSQIAFITREVAALEARHVSAEDSIAELETTKTAFDAQLAEMKSDFEGKIAQMKARDKKELGDWMTQNAAKQAEFRKRHTLDHSA
jgi:multidrug efflux pump subunit AcrA (membrane-fusion protein)